MSARSSVGEGGGVCQVVRCGCEASKLPVEVTLASGLVLAVAACPNHAERLLEEFDSPGRGQRGAGCVRKISVPIAGIIAAALLDHRWCWGTLASVLAALYCHRLYLAKPPVAMDERAWSPEDELRPGWAARWGVSRISAAGKVRSNSPERG